MSRTRNDRSRASRTLCSTGSRSAASRSRRSSGTRPVGWSPRRVAGSCRMRSCSPRARRCCARSPRGRRRRRPCVSSSVWRRGGGRSPPEPLLPDPLPPALGLRLGRRCLGRRWRRWRSSAALVPVADGNARRPGRVLRPDARRLRHPGGLGGHPRLLGEVDAPEQRRPLVLERGHTLRERGDLVQVAELRRATIGTMASSSSGSWMPDFKLAA